MLARHYERKISWSFEGPDPKENAIAKYFVPASTIASFMPTDVRF